MRHPLQSEPSSSSKASYLATDTIAALATATGGAIALLRISGPAAFSVLSRLAPGNKKAASAEPRKLYRAKLFAHADQGQQELQELDDALFVKFVAPESYTGEDVVELHIHGGAYGATRIMEEILTLGARQALPGEFSFRAVRNGKLTLSQAQAVADLIAAANDGAIGLALEKMSGTQNRLISELSKELLQLAAFGELGIDFADQDVEEVSLPSLKKRTQSILSVLERLHTSYDKGIRLQEGISVAFVGLPNAGKSTFFNALLGEDRSIVSEIAGTTRDVVRERLTLRGKTSSVTLRLEDTAGLRATEDKIEKIGIERTHKAAKNADLVLFLLDATQPFDAAQEQWQNLAVSAQKTIGFITKSDLASPQALSAIREKAKDLGVTNWVQVSAAQGHGISEAVEAITLKAEHLVHREKGEVLLTHLNQAQAVAQAIEHLRRALDVTEIDLFASDIRQSLHALSPLIGETVPDDILGKIFSDFCIGK